MVTVESREDCAMAAEDAEEYAKVSCCEGGGCAKAWRPARG